MKKIVKMQQESGCLMIFNQGFILQEADFVLCWHMSYIFCFYGLNQKEN